jgi:hypothetical protein
MPLPPLPKGYSNRGADSGRIAVHAADRAAPIKFHLVREHLTDGCYDSGGAYWGGPSDLWRVRSAVEVEIEVSVYSFGAKLHDTVALDHVEFFIRADSRRGAKRHLTSAMRYANARFFR